MIILKKFSLQLVLLSVFFGGAASAANAPASLLTSPPQNLTVEDAVRLASDRNLEIKQRKLTLDTEQINYDNAWDVMYMPSISLGVSSDSESTLGRVPGSAAAKNPGLGLAKGYPNSTVGITLGSYTLFNFYKDRLVYDSARLRYERAKQQYEEGKRSVRFRVIRAYFQAKTDFDKLEAAKRSMDLANAILSLVRSRVRLNQATADEFSSSSVDYLNAKSVYDRQTQILFESMANLNLLIDNDLQQKFILTSPLTYSPFKMSAEEAIATFKNTGPSIRDASLALKIAENAVELAEKNRLPLPTIGFSGITVGYTQAYGGGSNSLYNQQQPNAPGGEINLQAVVSFSIPLFGPGGFLGSRTVGAARIARDTSEISVNAASNNGTYEVTRSVKVIRYDQTQIQSNKEIFDSSLKLLESVFSRVSGARVNRLEIRDAIAQERIAEATYLDALLTHLTDKLSLAELMGVDRFPNEEAF